MDSRQQFEEWWLDGVYPLRRMDRMEDSGVSEEIAQEIWQASRESLVVELPDDGIEDCQREWGEVCKNTFDCGYVFACHKHEQAIHAAGIRTK